MNRTVRAAAVVVAVPVLDATTMGAAMAASDPAQVVIPTLDAQYLGPMSTAGRIPKIQVSASEVSRAFVNMVSYKTVSKVARNTDGRAQQKGDTVDTQGYRCKATSFKYIQPGSAGQYAKVGWKCTFRAADTPTGIVLTYKQSSK